MLFCSCSPTLWYLRKYDLQTVAIRNEAEQLLRLKQVALFAGIQLIQMPPHFAHGFERRAVFDAHKVALHEASLHQARRNRHLFSAQRKSAVQLGAEALALNILGQQGRYKSVHLLFNCCSNFRRHRHCGLGALVAERNKHLGRCELKPCGDVAWVPATESVAIKFSLRVGNNFC